jgi:hypothetical protein
MSTFEPTLLGPAAQALPVAVEAAGLALILAGYRRRDPRRRLRLTWRILEWQPLSRQREYFLGRGFALYRGGIYLFLLGVGLHLASTLLHRGLR